MFSHPEFYGVGSFFVFIHIIVYQCVGFFGYINNSVDVVSILETNVIKYQILAFQEGVQEALNG